MMYIASMKNEKKKVILNFFSNHQKFEKNNSEITFW